MILLAEPKHQKFLISFVFLLHQKFLHCNHLLCYVALHVDTLELLQRFYDQDTVLPNVVKHTFPVFRLSSYNIRCSSVFPSV